MKEFVSVLGACIVLPSPQSFYAHVDCCPRVLVAQLGMTWRGARGRPIVFALLEARKAGNAVSFAK